VVNSIESNATRRELLRSWECDVATVKGTFSVCGALAATDGSKPIIPNTATKTNRIEIIALVFKVAQSYLANSSLSICLSRDPQACNFNKRLTAALYIGLFV